MRLSLAFVLSLALAQATETNPSNTIRQRQVRRNDTDEPQRIKKLPRTSTDKKDKKSKDTVVQSDSKRDKKNKDAIDSGSKKKSKDIAVVEGSNSKKKSKDAVSQKKIKDALKEEKAKKEKISLSQKDLKKKLDVVDAQESEFAPVALDLGDILSGGRTFVRGNTVDQKDKENKRQKKKEAKESAGDETAETLVEEPSFQDIASVEQLDEPTFVIEGGRHKHVGHGRKKGRGKHGRGRGQKLQGEASGKSGKEEEFSRFRNKHHGGRRNGGKTKTKTRGYGKLRNTGSDMKDSSKKTSNKKTTVRMGARGSAYDGKARKLL